MSQGFRVLLDDPGPATETLRVKSADILVGKSQSPSHRLILEGRGVLQYHQQLRALAHREQPVSTRLRHKTGPGQSQRLDLPALEQERHGAVAESHETRILSSATNSPALPGTGEALSTVTDGRTRRFGRWALLRRSASMSFGMRLSIEPPQIHLRRRLIAGSRYNNDGACACRLGYHIRFRSRHSGTRCRWIHGTLVCGGLGHYNGPKQETSACQQNAARNPSSVQVLSRNWTPVLRGPPTPPVSPQPLARGPAPAKHLTLSLTHGHSRPVSASERSQAIRAYLGQQRRPASTACYPTPTIPASAGPPIPRSPRCDPADRQQAGRVEGDPDVAADNLLLDQVRPVRPGHGDRDRDSLRKKELELCLGHELGLGLFRRRAR